jgi:outer membrane cobalamin receptor
MAASRNRDTSVSACVGKPTIRAAAALALVLMTGTEAAAQVPVDLRQASLEDLLQVEITSASRKEQKVNETAAAVYVLTHEEIVRSGMTTLPGLLRLVPGVDIGRANANDWAVSVRGFNSLYANKLLVMIDGRTIYNPLFGGVFWNAEDLMLEDIERIEVIRGPGGAIWGVNAVNGVINVITKKSVRHAWTDRARSRQQHQVGRHRRPVRRAGWQRRVSGLFPVVVRRGLPGRDVEPALEQRHRRHAR